MEKKDEDEEKRTSDTGKTNFHRKSSHAPQATKNEKTCDDGIRDGIRTTHLVVGKMYSLNRWEITFLPLVRSTKNVSDFTWTRPRINEKRY